MGLRAIIGRSALAALPLWLRVTLVAVAYYALGALSLHLRIDDGSVVPFWLASGIALAGVLAWGPKVAIGTFVADVLVSIIVADLTPAVSIGIALGDTAEVLVAAWITLAIGETLAFSHSKCVLGLAIAAPLAAALSASVAVLLLAATGQLVLDPDRAWVRYWLSTVSGMVVVAPLLLAWLRGSWRRPRPARLGEAALLAALIAFGTWFVFARSTWNFLDVLVVVPLFMWSVVRFGTRGATGATALFAAFLSYGVLERRVVLTGIGVSGTADVMQVLVVLVAVANLIIAATLTERDEANVRLRELLASYDHSQAIAHVGSWELRLDGSRRAWCSTELCRMLHLNAGDDGRIDIETVFDAVHPHDRARVRETIERNLPRGQPFEVEHRVSDGSGRVLRHVAGIVDLTGDGNGGRRLVGSVLDVTDERRLEHFQSDLIATASHELRTPLTSILGFGETLARSWASLADTERREFVDIIVDQSHRLERLVEETLLQSRVEAGALEPAHRPFLVGRSVRRVVKLLGMDDVLVETPPGIRAIGDAAHFEQVLENLLTNAAKYGAPPVSVRVRERGDDQVEVRVDDHGPGMSRDFAQRAFDRFARGPDVGTAPGTGLGLSIAKGLVEAAGGTIHHERWDGVTTFVIRLPGEHRLRGTPRAGRGDRVDATRHA